MKNVGNTIRESLNTVSETIDAKKTKKIDNAHQKVAKMCEQMVNITTRINSIEQEMRTINQTCGEFHKNLQEMI